MVDRKSYIFKMCIKIVGFVTIVSGRSNSARSSSTSTASSVAAQAAAAEAAPRSPANRASNVAAPAKIKLHAAKYQKGPDAGNPTGNFDFLFNPRRGHNEQAKVPQQAHQRAPAICQGIVRGR